MALRVAAIDFLNPAPLMWDFTHPPLADQLQSRYDVQRTLPSECARRLLAGEADLGLIPVAALTSGLAIVPGCTIASRQRVRSILLVVKGDRALAGVRSVAADTASRSSVAYAQLLFRTFFGGDPQFRPASADAEAMLASSDAALLIGDPALLALERRAAIEATIGPCGWYDIAEQWVKATGLPWVAAVWAVRPEALGDHAEQRQLISDLNASRDHGLAHVEELVSEWTPSIDLPPATIRTYLTANIHYVLDPPCIEAIQRFRMLAAEAGVLPRLPELRFVGQ